VKSLVFKALISIFSIICIVGCVPYRDIVFLRSKNKSADSVTINHVATNYRVMSGDVLDIKVSSLDPQSIAIFNKDIGDTRANQVNEASIYLNGYSINDSGFVSLPIIGNVLVKDLEIQQVKRVIEEKMKLFYKYSSVDVKLMNFRITIVGEVNSQGSYPIYRDQVNIIQAIGLAGGFSDLANKKRIKIIRKENGKSKMLYLNLSDDTVLASEYYFLQPNDIIYVEPLKARALKINAPAIQLILSALTFIIVITNLVRR
jgi:polysaccharide biosynthesis/export protein